jgi:hypothetical protein
MPVVNGKAVFDVSVKGEFTGKVFEGQFVLKLFPTLKDRQQIAVEFSRRNLGNDYDYEMQQMTKAICELTVLCEKCPDWFLKETVWDLADLSPVVAVREGLETAQKEHMDALNK